MNTNFFSLLAGLDLTGDLHLTISKGANSNLIVSLLLRNEECGDSAKGLIPPLNLRGTTDELDNGFFDNITAPLKSASGLMVNMEAFVKQMEQAKKQSAMQKEKADNAKKEQDTKEKKYKDAMAKADELEKQGKFREAWTKVPETAEYPEKADEIRKRKSALAEKFAMPSLFGDEPEKIDDYDDEQDEEEQEEDVDEQEEID
ncbi:PRTRC system protein E [Pinibacter aurantiacus]|uniref:PRTRC system protein E n=1 Tax=Pinibacter aurantiacus TaxID=2851599 RepID=A0A9E2W4D3_9BACT|nr:PRTRC system protein E [Pinibacter aurantiacus]MBV4357348.1 PRTRC system protein E [Pinibacter aurantiacus]